MGGNCFSLYFIHLINYSADPAYLQSQKHVGMHVLDFNIAAF